MFDLELIPNHAALLRKSIAALHHFGPDLLELDVFPDQIIAAALLRDRGDQPKVLALLLITANLTDENNEDYVDDVYLELKRPYPTAFKVSLRLFLRNLAIVGDGESLFLSTKVSDATENLFFTATDSELNILRSSEMPMDEDYKDALLKKPERDQEYRAIIGIPADWFLELVIHLSHFGDSVNREIVFRKSVPSAQPRVRVECVIGGIEPAHPISFVFTLHVLRVIINAFFESYVLRVRDDFGVGITAIGGLLSRARFVMVMEFEAGMTRLHLGFFQDWITIIFQEDSIKIIATLVTDEYEGELDSIVVIEAIIASEAGDFISTLRKAYDVAILVTYVRVSWLEEISVSISDLLLRDTMIVYDTEFRSYAPSVVGCIFQFDELNV